MEALFFDKKSGSLKYSNDNKIPILEKDNDLIVRVEYSGVCGTDVHIVEGTFPCNDACPFVMGHEFVGVIEKSGPKASFKPGQRVVVDPNSGCGHCLFCHNGKYHLCPEGGIETTIGIWKDGGWARWCRVPDTQVLEVPKTITPQQAALCEPLSCLAHGLERLGVIPIGDNILIMGAGIIGNLWMIVLHLQGHKRVTVSEMNPDRLKTSSNMGLGYQFMTPDKLGSSGNTFDLIVDCTGSAPAMEASLLLLSPAGRYLLFGCANPKSFVKINPFEMYKKETTIIGVNINPFTFPKAIGLLESLGDRYLNYERLGIQIFSLSKYKEAFEALKKGAISKAVFKLE